MDAQCESFDWEMHWAHVLWEQNGLRMEDFYNMPRDVQNLYIASGLLKTEEIKRAKGR